MRSVFEIMPEAAIVIDPVADKVVEYNSQALKMWHDYGYDDFSQPISYYFRHCLEFLISFTESVIYIGKGLSNDLLLAPAHASEDIKLEVTASCIDTRTKLLCFCLRDKHSHEKWRIQTQAKRHHAFGSLEWTRIHEVFQNIEKDNQLILGAAGEGIYGVNADGLATFFNPAAERMLEWRAEEIIGKNIHSVIHHSHEDGSQFCDHDCPIYAAFRDGEMRKVTGDIFWSKSGQAIPVDYTSTPILDNGRLVGAVVVFRDISERLAAEVQLRNALEEVKQLKLQLEQDNAYLQEEISAEYNFHQIVGNSPAISQVIQQIQMVAPTDATVLINGESGTGKELIARAIHAASNRSQRPLVRVNCAAIPRELFESEFFGHVKGAFTGAIADRTGRFALADGGTLFLDEVGEIPLELQSKLLRVLQDNEFERVGDSTTRTVDVRVIAATNQKLKSLVTQGLFREDLYFRLNVFPILSAPLRDRLDDIPLLVMHFIQKICQRLNKNIIGISVSQINQLKSYHWPGNIRELENYLERQIILSRGGRLPMDDLPLANLQVDQRRDSIANIRRSKTAEMLNDEMLNDEILNNEILTDDQQEKIARQTIHAALCRCRGKIYGDDGAAKLLGVKPTTLASRIKKYGFDLRGYKAPLEKLAY